VTADSILVLAILAGAVILFVSERLRVDLIAMLVLITLSITGLVTIDEAFSGFSSPAVITVWSVYIVSGGLFLSGVADRLAQLMLRLAGENYVRILVVIMLTVGIMSSFMNNIGAVAILLPAVVSVGRKINVPPSKLLIPMSFVSLLGGKMTLIGTPPNILATSIMETYAGIEPFAFFDFAPMGILLLTTGVLYFVLVGRHLLPDRPPGGDIAHDYQIRDYISEMQVTEDSPFAGQTLTETRLGELYDLNVLQVRRDGAYLGAGAALHLNPGDVLTLSGAPDSILKAAEAMDLEKVEEWHVEDTQQSVTPESLDMIEVALAPRSSMQGQTLKEADLRAHFGVTVLAVRHGGESLFSDLANVRLNLGDALLIQGTRERIDQIRRDDQFLKLDSPPLQTRRTSKAPLAIAILVGVLVAVTAQLLHVSQAMLIGAMLMILLGVLNMDEAFKAIEWKSVFLIAGMLPLGIAMQNTGTAELIAEQITELLGGLGDRAVLMGIFLMTALLTEVMSNAAATVLVTPIAIDAARGLELNPQTFVMAVVIAAATSFLMPIGHQVNVLVYGPGGYKFTDYTKVGVWLNVVIFFLILTFLPLVWPL
jgi:di/tricarboxylate transporter